MKRLVLAVLASVGVCFMFFGMESAANPRKMGVCAAASGVLAGRFDGGLAQHYQVQCPSQGVYLRAGCQTSCINDAGPGDVVAEFVTNTDPFDFQLGNKEDSIWCRTTDGGVPACNIFLVVP